jgi:hypothetical protein
MLNDAPPKVRQRGGGLAFSEFGGAIARRRVKAADRQSMNHDLSKLQFLFQEGSHRFSQAGGGKNQSHGKIGVVVGKETGATVKRVDLGGGFTRVLAQETRHFGVGFEGIRYGAILFPGEVGKQADSDGKYVVF